MRRLIFSQGVVVRRVVKTDGDLHIVACANCELEGLYDESGRLEVKHGCRLIRDIVKTGKGLIFSAQLKKDGQWGIYHQNYELIGDDDFDAIYRLAFVPGKENSIYVIGKIGAEIVRKIYNL